MMTPEMLLGIREDVAGITDCDFDAWVDNTTELLAELDRRELLLKRTLRNRLVG